MASEAFCFRCQCRAASISNIPRPPSVVPLAADPNSSPAAPVQPVRFGMDTAERQSYVREVSAAHSPGAALAADACVPYQVRDASKGVFSFAAPARNADMSEQANFVSGNSADVAGNPRNSSISVPDGRQGDECSGACSTDTYSEDYSDVRLEVYDCVPGLHEMLVLTFSAQGCFVTSASS
jgi:hypothetical protein